MNNSFGNIPNDILQYAHDAWEFKTCQRSDGTTYGTRGDCVQKGAKEVKKGSKKSSWDPGKNLEGKLGAEQAKVASTRTDEYGIVYWKYNNPVTGPSELPIEGARNICKAGTGEMLGIDCGALAKVGSNVKMDLDNSQKQKELKKFQADARAKAKVAAEQKAKAYEAKQKAAIADAEAKAAAAPKSQGSSRSAQQAAGGNTGTPKAKGGDSGQYPKAVTELTASGKGGLQSASSNRTMGGGNSLNPVQSSLDGKRKITHRWEHDDHPEVERSSRTVRADGQAVKRIKAWERKHMPPESQWYFANSFNPEAIWRHPANAGHSRPGGNFWESPNWKTTLDRR